MHNLLNTQQKKLNICLIAYSCQPKLGSEDGIGWGWTEGLSKYVDIRLITRNNNVSKIKEELMNLDITNVKVIGCDLPKWIQKLKKGSRGAMLYHYFWHHAAAKIATQLAFEKKIDLVHHLTFSVTWQPCWSAFNTHIKNVWGPLDGAGAMPYGFLYHLGFSAAVMEYIRASIVWMAEALDPFVLTSYKKTNALLSRTRFIKAKIEKRYPDSNITIIPDTCLSHENILELKKYSEKEKDNKICRICFLGRLVDRKGAHLALEAFNNALEHHSNIEMVIIGDGPARKRLESIARNSRHSDKFHFTGRLPRQSAWGEMASCDIFLYPSLRDAVCTAVLEAMAAGLPVICLDKVGPAQAIDKTTGIVISAENQAQAIKEISEALDTLISNPELRRNMGKTAQTIASSSHTFEARAQAIMPIYKSLIDEGSERS